MSPQQPLAAGNELTTDGLWTYTYDNAGNETGKSNATDTWVYTYNNRNELVEADHHATTTTTIDLSAVYTYDAFGNRIKEAVTQSGTTTTTKFVLDGWDPALAGATGNANWNVLADVSNSGSLKTRYLRGDAVDQLFAELAYNGSSYTNSWTLTDIRGSVRTVIDNSANVLDAVNYGAFGNIITSGAQAETNSADRGRYAWSGRELDVETGRQYNRARFYDSATGRWMSQDPLGFDAGDSNLYRYVHNAPTNFYDPSGEAPGFSVTSITITDSGNSFYKGKKLGPYFTANAAAFAFQVKVEGCGSDGGTIKLATYSQKLFLAIAMLRVDNKWVNVQVNQKFVDKDAYDTAVSAWKQNASDWWDKNMKTDAAATGDHLRTGDDFVEWVDAPGYPSKDWGPNEPELPGDPMKAPFLKEIDIRLAIWVTAKGTDNKSVDAWFSRTLIANGGKDGWKLEAGYPFGKPDLPKKFP